MTEPNVYITLALTGLVALAMIVTDRGIGLADEIDLLRDERPLN